MKIRVGMRGSALSVVQTRNALSRIAESFPSLLFDTVPFETPGDRDRTTDLRVAPPDFFSRDLDEALLSGKIDFAVHSAKDLVYPLPVSGLDWFWLPWREDPRDAWVLRPGCALDSLGPSPVIGVSSDRRETYARSCFPAGVFRPVRGSIPDRIAQLDEGRFDALLMAGAALNRLGLRDRVTAWIPLERLAPPEAQGVLAITFREGDPVLTSLRARYVKAVRFVGAGVGSADLCTWGGVRDLQSAEVCLYDELMDVRLLSFLPAGAKRFFVGKRCGHHAMRQEEITQMILDQARRGLRVVRLKGGDPGLFGRLAEEIEALEAHGIPYTVRPGVSALAAATTGTGMLLTKRGVSRGFTALTPRENGGGVADVSLAGRARLPLVFFMSVKLAERLAADLMEEGWPADTPAALVYNAGGERERVLHACLSELHADTDECAPGLILIGSAAAGRYRRDLGALRGMRVLLTCSEALQQEAATRVIDFGGVPIRRPLIRLVPSDGSEEAVRRIAEFDWVALTSPAAVRIFTGLVRTAGLDIRRVPPILTCGPGCRAALAEAGLHADLAPESAFSAESLACCLSPEVFSGKRVLRFRSAKAGRRLEEALRENGAEVESITLYDNLPVEDGETEVPPFDAAVFASASAVETYVGRFGAASLEGKTVAVIGKPTAAALRKIGREPDAVAREATLSGTVDALADFFVSKTPEV
ncbi:MAG: uroporphyrinogen-III C-methyltransferase [Kiritimatiellae bacterium]|nr:uroporphyrinogen-III C-methyltransferase [Kiritimatiellia bacterium]